ncbi:hypothetical protein RCG23_14785 [Neobacillus sp. PS3-34]|uniref:hypothetical protein n=1 Tax=Neobacillus sp. PS3-34 TaxID=3070678 RepID=UPI0027E0C230|nr:hypothetical protein [Neobacillus sp. PS3-34]WML46896.1 hypothetical protein RCG23_14785 [Neobacillus sp. PS3-34]
MFPEAQGLTASMADSETGDPFRAIKGAMKLIQKEPSMENVLKGIQPLLEGNSEAAIDLTGLKEAFEKAVQLTGQGRELAARKELANSISKLEEAYPQLKKANDEPTLTKAEQYLINEAVQTLHLHSQNLLVTEITKKLSQMAIDFKKMRQEMSRNLDSASRLMEANKPGSLVPAKQMLEAIISKLDNAILKGNFMLYTDMTTEKKMLTASSKLAEAKNLLTKGNITEANQIVKEVKGVLDKLIFKPSDTRVKHFVSEENLLSFKSEDELSPKAMLEKALRPLPDQESGARHIFETIKKMGFTHETDSANAIIDKQEMPANLKSILMKMIETDSQSKLPVDQPSPILPDSSC